MPALRQGREIPALNRSLANHLKAAGWCTYTEIPLGAAQSENVGRADVLALKKSYSVRIVVYECKATRGDFLSDMRLGKYERYFGQAHQVYFATPSGLVKNSEVPEECGLITESEHGWRVAKAAPVHSCFVSETLLLQCLFREQEELAATRSLADRVIWEGNLQLSAKAKSLGYEIARKIQSTEIEWAEINKCKAILRELVGAKENHFYSLVTEVENYAARIDGLSKFPLALQLIDIAHGILENRPDYWTKDIPGRLEVITKKIMGESLEKGGHLTGLEPGS